LSKIIRLLEAKGYRVVAVHLTFENSAATKRIITLQDGPVILVGYSWGGALLLLDLSMLGRSSLCPHPMSTICCTEVCADLREDIWPNDYG